MDTVHPYGLSTPQHLKNGLRTLAVWKLQESLKSWEMRIGPNGLVIE